MAINYRIISIVVSLLFTGLILLFVKKECLNEKLAIFWLSLGIIMFLAAVFFDSLIYISLLLGIIDPNNLIFFGGIIFLLCFCLIVSVKISEFKDKIKILAQENAILKFEVSEIKKH